MHHQAEGQALAPLDRRAQLGTVVDAVLPCIGSASEVRVGVDQQNAGSAQEHWQAPQLRAARVETGGVQGCRQAHPHAQPASSNAPMAL